MFGSSRGTWLASSAAIGRSPRTLAKAIHVTLLVWLVQGCAPDTLPLDQLAVVNARLVTVLGDEPEGPVDVVMRGDTIVAVEPSAGRRLQPAPNVIDAGGRFLMAGLTDPHVHVRRSEELGPFLAAGVTTVRNMNGRFGAPLAWRDSLERGELAGPRFVTASPVLTDAVPGYAYDVSGPEEGRALVRRFHQEGYDLIKVYHLAEPSVRAIVDEASRLGIPVAGHIPLPAMHLDATLALGLVSLEHLDEFVGPGFAGRTDRSLIPAVARKLAGADVAVGTILAQWRAVNHANEDAAWLLRDSLVERARYYFGSAGAERLTTMAEDFRSRTEATRERDRSDFDFLFAFLRELDEQGVDVIPSTDAHQVLAPAGEGLWNELDLFVEAGLATSAALRSATVGAARALGREDRAGSVSVGKQADLLILDDDPLVDLRALRTPWGVVARGVWYDRAALARQRERGRS